MNSKERKFVNTVWSFYRAQGRCNLPWRKTKNPYRILVSEIMLQQTQVDRVVPKYKAFVAVFPTVEKLAHAELRDVLNLWQGLGYNRRAKYLYQAAKVVMEKYDGSFPMMYEELKRLPGVGPYTAAAVMNFAYNIPTPLIETNVRTVYLHHFYASKTEVTDSEILQVVEKTIDTKRAREWFSALMDYGSYLKKEKGNHNVRSKHYIKQSKFEGSDRQIRGQIISALTRANRKLSEREIGKELSKFAPEKVKKQLGVLVVEGLVQRKGRSYCL